MATSTISMPSQMNGAVVYTSLHAYNDALYHYTRKQFEDAERAARRQRERRVSGNPRPRTSTTSA